MGLRIVYGRSGSGKTTFCLNELKSRIEDRNQNKIILLVPEQYSFQAEKDLISVLKANGILETEVLSFQRMAHRIFNQTGGITYPHIHPAGKSMLIYRILDKLSDELKLFSKSANQEGFVNKINTLITEFKRYNVTPEQLAESGLKIEDNDLKQKLHELSSIYMEYEELLRQRYRDGDDDLTVAAQKLSEHKLYDGAEIWIDGFASFTPQQYKIIGELLKQAKQVTITLCIDSLDGDQDEKIDVFPESRKAYKKIIKICKENNIDLDETISLNNEPLARFRQSGELSHLEKNYNAFPYRTWDQKTRDIVLFSSLNLFTEVEETARDIISLCRDKNLRFRDIAVLTGNMEAYRKIIEVLFTEYGIPFFIDSKVDINNHPLVRMITSMMDIFIENWTYEAVFSYLKSGLTKHRLEDIDLLENYVLSCGIRGSAWIREWDMSTDLIPDDRALESQQKMLEEVNRIRKEVIEPLLEFRNQTIGRRTAAEFCGAIYDFLVKMEVPQRIESSIDRFKQEGNLTLANEYSQVWNTLMGLLDQTVESMGDETFGIERFSRIFRIGLSEYKIGIIPLSMDQVFVGSAERSRCHKVKALYLLGVNDGAFPTSGFAEGILSDQDRAILQDTGIELASDTRTQAFNEQYLIYKTLSTSENLLRISWPIADNDGKALRPSMVISRIRRLFPSITEISNVIPENSLEEELKSVSGQKPTFKSLITNLRKKADGMGIQPVWPQVYKWFFGNDRWKTYCLRTRQALGYRNLAGHISSQKVKALYGEPLSASVSRLERYTSCPFSFYIQYGLGAKERKIYRLSAPDIGTFMHIVIERFSRLVQKGETTWRSFDREWCDQKVSEIVDEMLQKMQGSGLSASKRYTVLTARLKRVVARAVWMVAQHIRLSDFEPVEYEVGFGDNDKFPPITVELSSGEKIKLTGRIDRIDAFKTEQGTYLRIIDYKSGAKDFKLSDLYYGLQIQLITYMDAIWENGKEVYQDEIMPGGILYFKIDDPIIKSDGRLSEEEVEKAIMKQLKMKGLLLADVKLIKAMDNTIEGSSSIIPATLNKGDVLGKNTSGATFEQFKLLRKYIRKLLNDIGSEILNGKVDIKPYKKKGTTACKYCSFLPICQFDPALKENTYKILFDKDRDEVWDLMGRGDVQ